MPPAKVIDTHHVLPRSWGGDDTPENRVRVCIQTHHSVHGILNLYVHAGGPPDPGGAGRLAPLRPCVGCPCVGCSHPRPPDPVHLAEGGNPMDPLYVLVVVLVIVAIVVLIRR